MDDESLIGKLRELLIEPNSTIFRALTTLLHRPNVQEVLKEFPLVLARDTSDFALLLYLLRAEVLATPTSFSLFRETTAPSLLLSSYAHLVGNEFFRQLLRPALEPVLHGAYSLDSQDDVVAVCDRILERLAAGLEAIPRSLAILHHILLVVVQEKFPNDKYTALGGFFLLRLVCPAIAAPMQYHIFDAGTTIDLQPTRFFATVSKVILMAGVGSRFHDDSKATLNSFLNEASAFILHILDHLADIGTSVVESLTATTVSAKSSRLSQALIRRQRRSLLQTPDLRSLGSHSLEIVFPDTSACHVKVNRSTTVDAVLEILMRMKTPPPCNHETLAITRAKYSQYFLFMGPSPKLQRLTGLIDPLDPTFRMCAGDELVWVGLQQPTYALWFLPVTDARTIDSLWAGKRIRDMEKLVVRVTIDGCSKALRASSSMTVEECVDALLRKLCKDSLGTVTDQLLTETKHKYKDYWLYAEAPNHTHILLMPSDAAQQLASYASSPAPLVFKKAPEYHQRQIMTQLYRREHGQFYMEDVCLRVLVGDDHRLLFVAREATTLGAMRNLLEQICSTSYGSVTPENMELVNQQYGQYWLFEPRGQAQSAVLAVSASGGIFGSIGGTNTNNNSNLLLLSGDSSTTDPLSTSLGNGGANTASSLPKTAPRKKTKFGLGLMLSKGLAAATNRKDGSDPRETSTSTPDDDAMLLGPDQRIWVGGLERELVFREVQEHERSNLTILLSGHVIRDGQCRCQIPLVIAARRRVMVRRKRAAMAMCKLLRDYATEISVAAREVSRDRIARLEAAAAAAAAAAEMPTPSRSIDKRTNTMATSADMNTNRYSAGKLRAATGTATPAVASGANRAAPRRKPPKPPRSPPSDDPPPPVPSTDDVCHHDHDHHNNSSNNDTSISSGGGCDSGGGSLNGSTTDDDEIDASQDSIARTSTIPATGPYPLDDLALTGTPSATSSRAMSEGDAEAPAPSRSSSEGLITRAASATASSGPSLPSTPSTSSNSPAPTMSTAHLMTSLGIAPSDVLCSTTPELIQASTTKYLRQFEDYIQLLMLPGESHRYSGSVQEDLTTLSELTVPTPISASELSDDTDPLADLANDGVRAIGGSPRGGHQSGRRLSGSSAPMNIVSPRKPSLTERILSPRSRPVTSKPNDSPLSPRGGNSSSSAVAGGGSSGSNKSISSSSRAYSDHSLVSPRSSSILPSSRSTSDHSLVSPLTSPRNTSSSGLISPRGVSSMTSPRGLRSPRARTSPRGGSASNTVGGSSGASGSTSPVSVPILVGSPRSHDHMAMSPRNSAYYVSAIGFTTAPASSSPRSTATSTTSSSSTSPRVSSGSSSSPRAIPLLPLKQLASPREFDQELAPAPATSTSPTHKQTTAPPKKPEQPPPPRPQQQQQQQQQHLPPSAAVNVPKVSRVARPMSPPSQVNKRATLVTTPQHERTLRAAPAGVPVLQLSRPEPLASLPPPRSSTSPGPAPMPSAAESAGCLSVSGSNESEAADSSEAFDAVANSADSSASSSATAGEAADNVKRVKPSKPRRLNVLIGFPAPQYPAPPPPTQQQPADQQQDQVELDR